MLPGENYFKLSIMSRENNHSGMSYATAILMVVIIFFVVMLVSIWPKGKNFEQAAGFDKWPAYQTAKLKVINFFKNMSRELD